MAHKQGLRADKEDTRPLISFYFGDIEMNLCVRLSLLFLAMLIFVVFFYFLLLFFLLSPESQSKESFLPKTFPTFNPVVIEKSNRTQKEIKGVDSSIQPVVESPLPQEDMATIVPLSSPSEILTEIRGFATWLCDPPKYPRCIRGYGPNDFVAAAGPILRQGNWRNQWVIVRVNGNLVRVQLIDSCWCKDRNGLSTLLDLTSGVFQQLAPLTRGVIEIEVQRLYVSK